MPSAPSALPRLAFESIYHALRLLDQRTGLAQPPGLHLQGLIFARLDLGAVDLVHHMAQVIGSPAHLVPPRRQRCFLRPQRGHCRVRLGHRGAFGLGVGKGIQDVPLRFRMQQ